MNITELARQVKIPTPELREILPEIGFDVGKKAIQVDDRMAQKIIEKLANKKTRESVLDKIRQKKKNEKEETTQQENTDDGAIKIGKQIMVKDFAKLLKVEPTKLIMTLMKNGVMASLNENIDFETATIIAEDLGFKVNKKNENQEQMQKEAADREKILEQNQSQNLTSRPPVITVMGHVDHGKTKLLDAVRKTNVVDGEAGGITQHIGAYQVEKNNQPITFIDTPGHEAFSAMRSRGAQVADIVVLVVAADDGVQPQTIEAISLIRSAKLPFVVAINKIDKPEANIEKIKKELSEIDVIPEDWGGDAVCVEISAKQNQNIDGLLETLLLIYEIEKENITADYERSAIGTIVESHLDKGEGPVATVLVQTGILNQNDNVKIGETLGKIRNMKNWKGENISQAPPSTPVRINGLKDVPQVGEILQAVKNVNQLKKEMRKNKNYKNIANLNNNTEKKKNNEIKKLNIILKCDFIGSQEAILESLETLNQPDLIVNIIQCGLGQITEVDVQSAKKQNAIILGFNTKPTNQAELLARDEEVDIKTSKIIYELLDFVKEKMQDMLEPEIKTTLLGQLEVIKNFKQKENAQIIGGKIIQGQASLEAKVNLIRNSEEIENNIQIKNLQSGKQNVNQAEDGQECGLEIITKEKIQPGDILSFIKEEKIERKI